MGSPSPTPAARAWLVIAHPRDLVRAQFFDVEHAVAGQIYHGVRLSFVEGGRVRREIAVMDRTIVDDVTIAEEDGAWAMSFVEGANAGARFVARFEDEDAATRVELEAFAPPSGFTMGLGKLSALGLEKTLKAMLAAHARAMEGYSPAAIEKSVQHKTSVTMRALAELHDLTEPLKAMPERERKGLVATLLEVACAIAIVSDGADAEERAVLEEVARTLAGVELPESGQAQLVSAAEAAAQRQGGAKVRCERLGLRLKTLGRAELGVAVAAIVAEASHGIDAPELAALQAMSASAGLPEAALGSILARVDDAFAHERAG